MKTTFEVRYIGAPYGMNESGEVVSRHRTIETAERAARKLQTSPKYYRNVKIVEIRRGR